MTDDVTTDSNVIPLFPEVAPAEHPEGLELQEWVFTNDKTNPMLTHLFQLLHDSAYKNKLGIMHAKLKKDDVVHTLIVGVELIPAGKGEAQVICWPIAKILTEAEQEEYMTPDGDGNWF
jgi:hypothetical protein